MTETEYLARIERNLKGVHFFSVGACPGCETCYEHAKDLQEELRKLDIESSIFINEGRTHAWVGVWIETITGQFISPDHDYKILEIR